MKKFAYGLIVLFLSFQSSFAQNCLTDNLSDAALWTHAGSVGVNMPTNTVSVTGGVNGVIRFNQTAGGTEDRVWRLATSTPLNTWRVDFDFTPTAQVAASHSIFDYTSNNLDPWYSPTKGTITVQNECGIGYSVINGAASLRIKAKVGDGVTANGGFNASSNLSIPAPVTTPSTTYFIRYERINGVTLRLSLFTTAERTTLVQGSTITMTIPCGLNGLQFIQSTNGWGASPDRTLSATLDNISLCPIAAEPTGNASLALPSVDAVTGCTGTSKTFTINQPIANATYSWFSNIIGGTLLATGTSYTPPAYTTPGTYAYSVSYTTSCGEVSSRAIAVATISQAPQQPYIMGNMFVCANQIGELTASLPNGVWSSKNPAIVSVKQTGVITGVSVGNTVISYTITSGACSSASNYVIVVNGAPTFQILGPDILCPSTSGNQYTVSNPVGGADYTWNIQNAPSVGVNFPVNGSNTCLLTTPGAGVISNGTFILRCQGLNACGASPMITKTITISNNVPPQPNITCSGSTTDNSCLNLSISNNAGYNILWTTASGTVLGTGTSIVRPLSTTVYCQYTSTVSGCTSRTAYSPAVICTYSARLANDPNAAATTELKSGLNLYPNPSNGEFTFETTGYDGHAQVLNLLGMVVKEFDLTASQKVYHVDMQDQAKTKYLLRLTGGPEAQSTLFVIQ